MRIRPAHPTLAVGSRQSAQAGFNGIGAGRRTEMGGYITYLYKEEGWLQLAGFIDHLIADGHRHGR